MREAAVSDCAITVPLGNVTSAPAGPSSSALSSSFCLVALGGCLPLRSNEITQRSRDAAITGARRVPVDQRRPHRSVSHPLHQLVCGRTRRRGELVSHMAEIVEMEATRQTRRP